MHSFSIHGIGQHSCTTWRSTRQCALGFRTDDNKEPLTLPDKADVVLKVSEGLFAALKMSGAAG